MGEIISLDDKFEKCKMVWSYLCKKHFKDERLELLNSGGGYCEASFDKGDTCDFPNCKNKPFKEVYYNE